MKQNTYFSYPMRAFGLLRSLNTNNINSIIDNTDYKYNLQKTYNKKNKVKSCGTVFSFFFLQIIE